jgi:anti-sigma factor RsiW
MCEVQGKLVAWLDRELAADEAVAVQRHVERCEECRRSLAKYETASKTFEAYCDAVMAAKAPRRAVRGGSILAGALVTAVAAAVMFLVFRRTPVEPSPVLKPTVATASVLALEPSAAQPVPRKAASHKRHVAPRVREYVTKAEPMDTAIEIAIPAEAMFPPGAMPNGVNFVADVRIAPDGSVQQVRLRQ